MGNNPIRCCHGEEIVDAKRKGTTAVKDDGVPRRIPSSRPAQPRHPGAIDQAGGACSSTQQPPSCPGKPLDEDERAQLREQLRGFIAEAIKGIPVALLDFSSGTTVPRQLMLDRNLQELSLEGSDEANARHVVPLSRVLAVHRPEDCLAWDRAGLVWPPAKLRRLALISALDANGSETLWAVLDADESRRERLIMCMTILSMAPEEQPVQRQHSPREGAPSSSSAPFAPAGVSPREGPMSPSSPPQLVDAVTKAETAPSSCTVAHGTEPQGWLHEQSAEIAVSQLRQLTRQFVQDAVIGISCLTWIDLTSGERTECRYRFDRALAELVFARNGQTEGKAPSQGRVLGTDSCASTAASSSEARECLPARVPLARIQNVTRPQHSAHLNGAEGSTPPAWFIAMSSDERERFACVELADPDGIIDASHCAGLPSAFGLLERDALCRERFVICVKVLRFSVW